MMNRVIEKYIQQEFTPDRACRFSRELLEAAGERVRLRFVRFPWNVQAVAAGSTVYINLWPFLGSCSRNTAKYYMLSAAIFYEWKLLRLDRDLEAVGQKDAAMWLAAGERQLFPRQGRCFCLFDPVTGKQRRQQSGEISAGALLCLRESLRRANALFAPFLDREGQLFRELENGAAFMLTHLEIGYPHGEEPVNRFGYFLSRRAGKRTPPESPLAVLLREDGTVRSLLELWEARTEENAGLLDGLMLQVFLRLEEDCREAFEKDPWFKCHMESLVNGGITQRLDYLKNMEEGSPVAVDAVLQDNAAMVIRDVRLLDKLLKTYGMEKTSGSVIPLYPMG